MLTAREQEVLRLLADGKRVKEIAHLLNDQREDGGIAPSEYHGQAGDPQHDRADAVCFARGVDGDLDKESEVRSQKSE